MSNKHTLRSTHSRPRSADSTTKPGETAGHLSWGRKRSHVHFRRDTLWLILQYQDPRQKLEMRRQLKYMQDLFLSSSTENIIKLFMNLKLHSVHFAWAWDNHIWSAYSYIVPPAAIPLFMKPLQPWEVFSSLHLLIFIKLQTCKRLQGYEIKILDKSDLTWVLFLFFKIQ